MNLKVVCGLVAALLIGAVVFASRPVAAAQKKPADSQKVVKTEAEWKKVLSPAEFNILRKAGTETPYSGKYWDFHGNGIFVCAACGQELFSSKTKFDSHTGWPSFWQAIRKGAVIERVDRSLGEVRTEVLCARCGGHLGHVFTDGPKPTGLRYCLNSPALKFKKGH